MKTIYFQQPIEIFSAAAAVGSLENEGLIGPFADTHSPDDQFGANTWEMAETEMVRQTIDLALKKANLSPSAIDVILAGDLLNQCTATAYGALPFHRPYIGLYGACSTFAEGLYLGSLALESGHYKAACVTASSHFSSAERQYRFPLEYGCQRTPTAQRTVTGAGAALLGLCEKKDPAMRVCAALPGRMIDSGVTDANNMGAAMAPAAADTLLTYFWESNTSPDDYDLILTGDLGAIGADLLRELCADKGVTLGNEYKDCGLEIFDPSQDVHAGASGCGCSAVYVCGYLKKIWNDSPLSDVLLIGTGALLSPLTVQQNHTIPGIAHLIRFSKTEI